MLIMSVEILLKYNCKTFYKSKYFYFFDQKMMFYNNIQVYICDI